MADEAPRDNLERTEEPTPKRREEARKKGQFAKSRTLIPAATLIALAITLRFGGQELMIRMGRCVSGFFAAAGTTRSLAAEDLIGLSSEAGLLFAPVLLPFFGAVVLAGMGTGFLQTGFVLAAEPLHLDLSRINPINGFRRLFSFEAAGELVKSFIFIAAIGVLGGAYLYADLPALAFMTKLRTEDMVVFASREAAVLISWMTAAMGALAGLDYLYQRWRTEAQLRMSRQEIKEEMREQEGDPQLKGRLKSLRQKISRRRMTAEVAKADVVITNPTELAIALRYRADEMSAPRVLGKGAGYIAKKIREIAREKGIPIVENKPLARLLYRQVDVGQEISENVYRAVAEVLAYVYKLRRGNHRAGPQFTRPHA
jgi:flagellar biosynthetic protein FlhB